MSEGRHSIASFAQYAPSIHSHSKTSMSKKRNQAELDNLKKELNINDHLITLNDLCKRYKTNMNTGLTEAFALTLLEQNGPNMLIPSRPKSRWLIFAENMFLGISTLLWVGAILSFIGFGIHAYQDPTHIEYDHMYIGIVLTLVVSITGFLGFYQEAKNNSIMQSFQNMVPKYATVIRDSQKSTIFAEGIVLGDLVSITSGECIPADIRIIDAHNMKVDNSSLTGESEPQSRSTDCTDKNPMETQNLAFFGTNVVEGEGKGIVIACGDNTLMGRIAGLTSGLQPEETPMKKELRHFMKIITIIALVIGVIFFIISLILGNNFFTAFVYFIAITVANVPEGLLVTLTVCLTLTARRMLKKNCLVKNQQGIETLGATNVICSDKTGTLTQNKMTVSHMYFAGELYDVLGDFDKSVLTKVGFKALSKVGTLCLRAVFDPADCDKPAAERGIQGDASEKAVLKCMEIMNGNTEETRATYEKVAEIPFNSTNKYQVSVHKQPKDQRFLVVMKGAPEKILDRCTTFRDVINENVSLGTESNKRIQKAMSEMGAMGERVLGFADFVLPASFTPDFKFNSEKVNFPLTGLRFVGLMSMIDPPRPGVPEAVQKCRTAGISVYMVTGDHPVTAMAIARKVGILSKDSETVYDLALKKNVSVSKVTTEELAHCNAAIITGTDLKDMDQEQVKNIVLQYHEIVFARTSPQQKLKIVEAIQSLKKIVAVTGDGVNDSPALKKADIGISMGISGSPVSKEAADMIILDDNFATIVVGIEEGRLIYDNLKKSIAFIMTSNVPEVIPFLIYASLSVPPVLSVMAILVINVGTDLWPGIALAYETAERDIMLQMPRDPSVDNLVNFRLIWFVWQIGFIQACAGFTCYFFTMALHGFFPEKLIGMRKSWESKHINNLEDSYGQEWTYEERTMLTRKCYSSFFMAIVITQIIDALICKTRRRSLFQQGIKNWCLNGGLIFEIIVAALVTYCPGLNSFLLMAPLEWYILLPSLPFAIVMLAFDEIRKLLIRKFPNGCVEKETYY